jgi:ABC-type transporter Mla subunit MlaD
MISINSPSRPLLSKKKNNKRIRHCLCIIALIFAIFLCILLSTFSVLVLPSLYKSIDNFNKVVKSISQEENDEFGSINSIINTVNTILNEVNEQYPIINSLINQIASITGSVQYVIPRIINVVDNTVPVSETISSNINDILKRYYDFSNQASSVLTNGQNLINQSLDEYPMIIETVQDVKDLVDEIRHYINSTQSI